MILNIDVKKVLTKAFKDLCFEEKWHTYTLDGKRLVSVSKKVEDHCEKFDIEKMLPLSAAKETRVQGKVVTVDELRQSWKEINEDACKLGHETHNYLEIFDGLQSPYTPQEKAGVEFLKWLFSQKLSNGSDRYIRVAKELRMFSRKYKYAGTADLIIYDNLVKQLVLVDYKTNKDLFRTWGTLLEPFDYLESHPYNKYQLQFSYYQIMLEEIGFKVSNRILAYLQRDGEYIVYYPADFTQQLKEYMETPIKKEKIKKEKYLW